MKEAGWRRLFKNYVAENMEEKNALLINILDMELYAWGGESVLK